MSDTVTVAESSTLVYKHVLDRSTTSAACPSNPVPLAQTHIFMGHGETRSQKKIEQQADSR